MLLLVIIIRSEKGAKRIWVDDNLLIYTIIHLQLSITTTTTRLPGNGSFSRSLSLLEIYRLPARRNTRSFTANNDWALFRFLSELKK